MQDPPRATELLDLVAEFLRATVVPQLSGHDAFHARVAANALELVKREVEQRSPTEQAELASLQALLGQEGSLEALNARLGQKIAADEITLGTPGLAEHLWATTLAKLAIDQPTYAPYRRETGKKKGEKP